MSLTFIANTLQESTTFQIIVCGILGFIILKNYKKFLLWIIFLPYSGIWLYHLNSPWEPGYCRELMYVSSYIELLLVSFFMWRWFLLKKTDKISLWLAVMPITAIPSLVNSSDHFGLSLFILVCLFCGAGVYRFFLDNMEKLESSRLLELAILTWLILGVLIKIYQGARLGESGLLQRGGGILGSNHLAGVLLLMLPLVKNRWITFAVFCFLIIQFSRGIYGALLVYAVLWILFVSARNTFKVILGVLGFAFLFLFLTANISFYSNEKTWSMMKLIYTRFRVNADFLPADVWAGLRSNPRIELWHLGLMISNNNGFMGSGLGGTYWELVKFGYPYSYSNLHNLYLTSLVEGGFLFSICLAGFIGYLLFRSFKVSKPVFVGLATWAFYGMFSGEIYEVGGFATAGDYYVLLFVVAYLSHIVRKSKKRKYAELA